MSLVAQWVPISVIVEAPCLRATKPFLRQPQTNAFFHEILIKNNVTLNQCLSVGMFRGGRITKKRQRHAKGVSTFVPSFIAFAILSRRALG